MEDQGEGEGWLQLQCPPFEGNRWHLSVLPRRASILDGSHGIEWKELDSCSPLHPRIVCLILSTPLLSQNPGHQMARAGCVYLRPWKPAASSPIILGQVQAWSPASQQLGHRMVLTLLFIIPEMSTWVSPWLCSLEQLISSHHGDTCFL